MKHQFFKRTVAAALALLIVSGTVPMQPVTDLFGNVALTASAGTIRSGVCGENLNWFFDDKGKLTIIGTGDMYNYNNGIGASADDMPPWIFSKCTVKSVVILNGVTSIGDFAFDSCNKMTSVSIPDSVTSIGDYAFNSCSIMTDLTLPDRLKSIGCNAFSGCSSLTSVTIPGNVTSISQGAFSDCTGLTSIIIPRGVTKIDNDVFSNVAKDFKICCYKNSFAEKYAIDNNISYELIATTGTTNPTFSYTPGDSSAILKWEAVSGAERYGVAVVLNKRWTIVAKTDKTSYTMEGLKAGVKYKVAIVAMYDGSWCTDLSNATDVSPNLHNYPSGFSIYNYPLAHKVGLGWNEVKYAQAYGVAMKVGDKWKVITQTIPGNTTIYTSPKLQPGDTYTLVVVAKVNGKWDTTDLDKRTVKVTVI